MVMDEYILVCTRELIVHSQRDIPAHSSSVLVSYKYVHVELVILVIFTLPIINRLQ